MHAVLANPIAVALQIETGRLRFRLVKRCDAPGTWFLVWQSCSFGLAGVKRLHMRTNSIKADRVRNLRLFAVAGLLLLAPVLGGCDAVSQLTGRTFHERFRWRAKDFFDDPQVIALCHAIEGNDLNEIDRLIAAGADVNAKGKDNMTPLLWAFPDNKLKRFTRLLEHGADPNVAIQSDLNTRGGFGRGDSVTHMACRTEFAGYFEAVFGHGGDPNFLRNGPIPGDSPLHSVITGEGPNKKAHVQVLIKKGTNLNHMNGAWATPPMQAVSWGSQFGTALLLLEAGADWRIYVPKSNTRLVHIVVMAEDRESTWTPQQAGDYQKLVRWLEYHGDSLEQAHVDLKRWKSWSSAEFRRKMDAEIEERITRERGATSAARTSAEDEASTAPE
jgi:hypothetical protein